jgi:hypothetical protein
LFCLGRLQSVSDLRYDLQVSKTHASTESSHSQFAAWLDRVRITPNPLTLAIV